jgi:hypothetical protein
MKLYLYCGFCNTKLYLQSSAPTRRALAKQWGTVFNLDCPHCRSKLVCSVQNTYAEASTDNTVPGAIVGGLFGLLAGPVGVLVGGLLGGATGHSTGDTDRRKVNQYNQS